MIASRVPQSRSITAAEQALTLTCSRQQRAVFQLTATALTGTITFEATVDGTNWFAVGGHIPSVAFGGAVVASLTAAGVVRLDVTEYQAVRARCSAWTSGTAVVLRGHTAYSGLVK